jgi:signal transduction histidine kinase
VDERNRISQDLHDSIIQSLYALGLSLEDLPEIFGEEPAEGVARVDRAIDSIHSTIRDIRNMIVGLRPELLEDADLDTGIHTLAAGFRLNTLIDLDVTLPDPLPELATEQVDQLLTITREALSNIARHSGASRAEIQLTVSDDTLTLLIGDNGKGFDPLLLRTVRQHGLTNLSSRAEGLGGTLRVKSQPGAGTQLEASIPVSRGDAA